MSYTIQFKTQVINQVLDSVLGVNITQDKTFYDSSLVLSLNFTIETYELTASGIVGSVSVGAPGLGYAPLDVLTLAGGYGDGATVRVATIGAGGTVSTITLLTGGTGYEVGSGLSTTVDPSGGTGCTIDVDTVIDANWVKLLKGDIGKIREIYTALTSTVQDEGIGLLVSNLTDPNTTGIATGGSATTLINTTANFVTLGVTIGAQIVNITDGGTLVVTAITTTTNPNDTLHFASGSTFGAGDSYKIFLAKTFLMRECFVATTDMDADQSIWVKNLGLETASLIAILGGVNV